MFLVARRTLDVGLQRFDGLPKISPCVPRDHGPEKPENAPRHHLKFVVDSGATALRGEAKTVRSKVSPGLQHKPDARVALKLLEFLDRDAETF
jgi:hypothetical protein